MAPPHELDWCELDLLEGRQHGQHALHDVHANHSQILTCKPAPNHQTTSDDTNGAMRGIFQNIVNAKNKTSKPTTQLAKPDSCEMDLFLYELCPCVLTEAHVIICEGLNYTSIPNTLLSTVYKIRMSNNSIYTLDNVVWPKNLTSLVLQHNKLKFIGKSTFNLTSNLSKLYLSYNEISYIHEDAFDPIPGLTILLAEKNKLTQLAPNKLFKSTPMIKKVYLGENQLQLVEETRFSSCCRYLTELLLDHNQITHIRAHWFSNMSSLVWLSLTYNQITHIEDGAFNWNYELEELNLSFNKIKVINRLVFSHKLNIQKLYLGGNPLKPLAIDTFREIEHLKSLNLQHVDFSYIQPGTFAYLTRLEFIYFEKFIYCHYANHVRVCRPLTDGLSSVQELLAFPVLKYAVWIVASVCSLGNVFVFVWRSVSPHEDRTLSLLVRNLSIADLMMGIYLGAIGWQDWKFQHHFGRFAIEWMSSWKCTAIGFLAMLSSELSVFILTIITVERYRSITSIRSFEERAQKRRARLYVSLAWLFSLLIAIYPVVEWYLRWPGQHATNGLCLPLHIDQPFTHGWQYSAFVYLGINFLAVVIIIALYVHMYAMIINGRQISRPVSRFRDEKREDAILAIRFFFIVITDCLCWIPIVVIKIMALANFNISSSICGWLVIFIIPINSALNPILYTLAAPTSLRTAVCRLFERFCDKMDALTGSVSTAANGSSYSHSSHSSSATSGTCQLDGSSTASSSCALSMPRRRRRKTNSRSASTCDTFETSIVSHKASVESAPLVVDQQHVASSKVALDLQFDLDDGSDVDDDEQDDVVAAAAADASQRAKFTTQSSHMTDSNGSNSNKFVTLNKSSNSKPYDCLSSYENNGVKLKLVRISKPSLALFGSLICKPFGRAQPRRAAKNANLTLEKQQHHNHHHGDDESSPMGQHKGGHHNMIRQSDKDRQCSELVHLDDDANHRHKVDKPAGHHQVAIFEHLTRPEEQRPKMETKLVSRTTNRVSFDS